MRRLAAHPPPQREDDAYNRRRSHVTLKALATAAHALARVEDEQRVDGLLLDGVGTHGVAKEAVRHHGAHWRELLVQRQLQRDCCGPLTRSTQPVQYKSVVVMVVILL